MSIRRFWKWYYIIPAAPFFIALFVFITGGIVMLLWNWLLPPLVGLPEITLLKGFGLLVLCRMLFGGFGGGGGDHSKSMTPEERERFRRRVNERFCRTPGESEESPPTVEATSRAGGSE
jgi:hypothetical protein